jgi:formamidopyrimidine-DNA glycosylase
MPELPEVETVRRDLAVQLRGAQLSCLRHLDWPRMLENSTPEQFAALIQGVEITRVDRRAKWLLLHLESGVCLALHLRMSGSLFVAHGNPPPDAHTRLILDLTDGGSLVFRDVRKFGRLRVLSAEGWQALDAAHGPEPLAPEFTATALHEMLHRRRTALKPLLLNQAFVAGLGNIYVDEALWEASLHPLRPAHTVTLAEATRLQAAIQNVLENALKRRGSTLRDYRTGTGQVGENQHHFRVYGRTGQPCPRCQTPVLRCVVAQRGTHVCPLCQPTPGF